jgi:hypothetical protein
MASTRLGFTPEGFTGKTYVWTVQCGGVKLGEIRWYAPWRRYCYWPDGETILDASCLREVVEFIDGQMSLRIDRPTSQVEDVAHG